MAYIGNQIYQSAFVTDQFSGDGTTTAFTMSVAPAGVSNVLVVVSGVVQDPSTYGVVGTTLNFTSAPPSGTGNISCRYLGVPVTGVTTTAYRTVTEFTATASQTTFTPPSYTVGFINVYRNGVLLGSADYTASNGTTVVLATGATVGDLITVESFQVSSVVNAIQNTAGSVSSTNIATGAVTADKLASGLATQWTSNSTAIYYNTGRVGVGTSNPSSTLHLSSTLPILTFTDTDDSATTRVYQDNADFVIEVDGTDTKASSSLKFQVDNTVRMTIDSAGRMTVPGQPSFKAGRSAGNVGGNTRIVFGTSYFNVGNNFNTSTGVFTAPVAGRYLFSANMFSTDGASPQVQLRKNSSKESWTIYSGGGYGGVNLVSVVNLSANDTVDVFVDVGSIYASGDVADCTFSGYLLG
jgi:hypothetical protein